MGIVEKEPLTIESILKNKKIIVKPIFRNNGNFPKGHDGEFMFTDTVWSTDLRPEPGTNRYKAILTEEERLVFEKTLNLEPNSMSFYKKTGFWPKFRVKLTKEGKTLNLSEPLDYLEYLVLLADRRVAPNWNAKYDSGEYKFALVDEDETIKDNVNKSDLNKKAYKYLGKIEDSVEDMTMVIRLASNKIVKSKDVEFLQSEVQKIIDSNIKGFVEVMEDKSFGTKAFINKALDAKALDRTVKGGYALKGGDEIGRTLSETVEFLESNKNQDIFLKLKAQIDNKK
tara:strand:- start:964 stop:1815 length:852 start_codon:yes stop_codon:yes gene_type:complete